MKLNPGVRSGKKKLSLMMLHVSMNLFMDFIPTKTLPLVFSYYGKGSDLRDLQGFVMPH